MSSIQKIEFSAKTGETCSIRTVELSDANAFMGFAKKIFQSSDHVLRLPEEYTITLEQEEKWIQENLDNPSSLVLVAEYEGSIIGDISCSSHNRLKKKAHISEFGMGILEEWRGQGVGSALLSALVAWARGQQQVEKLCMSAFSTNPHGLALYKKFGFQEEGRRLKQFKQKDGSYADEVMMALFV